MNTKKISLFEIFLMVSMTFAVSYLIRESDNTNNIISNGNNSPTLSLKEIVKKTLDWIVPSVSAASVIATCVQSKSGKTCQEYAASVCDSKCASSCVPSAADQVADCKPGTCYDSSSGVCQSGSPKVLCDADGGKWFDDKYGNIPQCSKGCCILGSNVAFTTAAECGEKSAVLGLAKDFRTEIQTEIGCLALAGGDEQGACVYEQDYETTCKFTTKTTCNTMGGDFQKGYLCSNPQLKTNCKPQKTAKCVQGKDGLYWFDSCGNMENIYSANKVESYNNGMILPENSSCQLGTSSSPLVNQKTCGNCNYLLGSICGTASSNQKLADSTIDFVCRDLSCVDSKGKEHKQGESWCTYQSSIGVDSANNRATDTVGSRQFRQTCLDGEISTESCGDYRTGICVQANSGSGQSSFSSAACRPNTAMECLNYNTNNEIDKCAENTDCFVKHVQVGSDYKFDFCASKYPIGFDLAGDATSAQAVCGMASQSCTVTYVKTLFSGWQCKQNCECEKAAFAQQMNNLCMSLGDCGAKINYIGKLSSSYKVANSPKLDSSYLTGLNGYKTPVNGKIAEPGDSALSDGTLGIPTGLGSASAQTDSSAASTSLALKTGGAMGITLIALANLHVGGQLVAGAGSFILKIPYLAKLIGTKSAAWATSTAGNPALIGSSSLDAEGVAAGGGGVAPTTTAALGGALAGAAVGMAVTGLLIKVLGIGGGLSKTESYALLAAGTYAGAMMGYSLMTQAAGACATGAGCVVAVVVVIIMVIMKLLGVGKTKTVTVNFQCQPWQAPTGGADCSKCGLDGLGCSRYACETLGQTCEFINEGTSQAACINNNKNDVTPPVINPDENGLQNGYKYDTTGDGYKLTGPDGCLKAYSTTTFGIKTDEASQCRYDTVHTTSFDNMEFDFGGSNLYTMNHTSLITLPDLASLGLSNYDPSLQTNYNFYVRCKDKNGNANQNEYIINFCLIPGDDITPPLITRGEPTTDFVPYGTTQEPISVYTNEPAECRWSSVDSKYDDMTNQFGCANNLADQTVLGWACSGVASLPEQENKIFVRCLDQPWQNDTSKRNANTQSLAFTLKKTDALTITSLTPDNEVLKFNTDPATVTVRAETSGGVDGTAVCSAKFGENYVQFQNTGGSEHSQAFNQLSAGDVQLNVRCVDAAGNIADRTSSFTVDIDTTAPDITRVYANSGNLIVITLENSACYFNKQSCVYDLSNSTAMDGSDLTHTTSFDSSFDYYIKCKDEMGNVPGACSLVVRKGDLT